MSLSKNSFCSYCGRPFVLTENEIKDLKHYPRSCYNCKMETYNNPIPVVITMVSVYQLFDDKEQEVVRNQYGYLLIKRNIEPKKDQWAFPGGYMDAGESWQESSARELREEVGLDFPASDFQLVDVLKGFTNTLLIMNLYKKTLYLPSIKLVPNNEVSAIKGAFKPEELAFPYHTEMLDKMLKNNVINHG